jgi:hypothetical protein
VLEGPPIKLSNGLAHTKAEPISLPATPTITVSSSRVRHANGNSVRLERWQARALAGLKTGLRERAEDPAERELAEAHRRIGELSMEVELLRARIERPGPLARRRSR